MRLAPDDRGAHLRSIAPSQRHWQRLARQRALINVNHPFFHLWRHNLHLSAIVPLSNSATGTASMALAEFRIALQRCQVHIEEGNNADQSAQVTAEVPECEHCLCEICALCEI